MLLHTGGNCRRIGCGFWAFVLVVGSLEAPVARCGADRSDFLCFHLIVGFPPVANRVSVIGSHGSSLVRVLVFRVLQWSPRIGSWCDACIRLALGDFGCGFRLLVVLCSGSLNFSCSSAFEWGILG